MVAANSDPQPHNEPASRTLELLNDIQLCLVASGPTTVVSGPGWFQYEDPDLEAALLGFHTLHPNPEIVPHHLRAQAPLNPEVAQAVVRSFIQLEPKIKNRVRKAMERLHLALARRSSGDQAVELAIALEAVLVDSPGENTFKIALRSALLSAKDVEARSRARAIIEATYKVRSALMHSGDVPDKVRVRGYGEEAATAIIAEAMRTTALVIQRLVRDGTLPHWSHLELAP